MRPAGRLPAHPEKPAVVQKNNLDQQIMQTAAPSSSDATEDIWQETLEQNGVKVNIDAAVEIPDVASWSVTEVSTYGFKTPPWQYWLEMLSSVHLLSPITRLKEPKMCICHLFFSNRKKARYPEPLIACPYARSMYSPVRVSTRILSP